MFTLLVPGIESGRSAAAPRLPALERLLARGRSYPLEEDPWSALARLAGGALARWPVAPVSALAELSAETSAGPSAEGPADPYVPEFDAGDGGDGGDGGGVAWPACLRVEPLGARAEEQGMFRLPAGALGITRDEARALASAFDALFAAEGLRLVAATPERWYLRVDAARWPALQWRGFDGPARSLAEQARPAPPEPALRLLLSEVEMLFYAHPVNEARRAQGAATIAGLHPWGGGRLGSGDAGSRPASSARSGGMPDTSRALSPAPAPGEPYLAGLIRLGALGGAQGGRYTRELAADGFAWPVAAESIGTASWEAVDTDWAAPLLAALLRGGVDGIRIVTAAAVHETSRFAALRFWRRPRPVQTSC